MNTRHIGRSCILAGLCMVAGHGTWAKTLDEAYADCNSLPLAQFEGTIVDAAVATPELSTLVGLVTKAGLVGALSGPGPFTVYAPKNSAFEGVPSSVLNSIAEDAGLLTAVLTYHVSPGSVDPRAFKTARERKTLLSGQSVFVDFDRDGPKVNQSIAGCQGFKTSNGTVWLIDSVLLPQFR